MSDNLPSIDWTDAGRLEIYSEQIDNAKPEELLQMKVDRFRTLSDSMQRRVCVKLGYGGKVRLKENPVLYLNEAQRIDYFKKVRAHYMKTGEVSDAAGQVKEDIDAGDDNEVVTPPPLEAKKEEPMAEREPVDKEPEIGDKPTGGKFGMEPKKAVQSFKREKDKAKDKEPAKRGRKKAAEKQEEAVKEPPETQPTPNEISPNTAPVVDLSAIEAQLKSIYDKTAALESFLETILATNKVAFNVLSYLSEVVQGNAMLTLDEDDPGYKDDLNYLQVFHKVIKELDRVTAKIDVGKTKEVVVNETKGNHKGNAKSS